MKNGIQFRIGAMLIVLTTLILCGFGIHQYRTQQAREITRLTNIAFLATEQLALNLNFPIWNYDDEQIQKVIETEMQEESISAVIVRDHIEILLANKTRDEQWQVIDTSKDIPVGNIKRSKKIVRHDKKIGTVEVYVTDHFMKKDLCRAAWNILFTIIVLDLSLLIVLIISLRIMLVRPVNRLLTIADAIAGGDFQPDIEIHRNDEIGRLANCVSEHEGDHRTGSEGHGHADSGHSGRQTGHPRQCTSLFRGLARPCHGINNIIDVHISVQYDGGIYRPDGEGGDT